MVAVKVYDTETGHVETVNEFDDSDRLEQRKRAEDLYNQLILNDHGTATVYYLDEYV